MNIKLRIKRIRNDAGLSQREFGQAVGVTPVVVSGWETGRVEVGKSRLYVIAEKFSVNIDWLLYGEGKTYKTVDAIDEETRARIEDEYIIKLFSSLPPETQERILEVLRRHVANQKDGRGKNIVVNNNGTFNGNIHQE